MCLSATIWANIKKVYYGNTAKDADKIGLKSELSMPVKWIGVGEGMDDLRPFVANDFAAALFNQKVEE